MSLKKKRQEKFSLSPSILFTTSSNTKKKKKLAKKKGVCCEFSVLFSSWRFCPFFLFVLKTKKEGLVVSPFVSIWWALNEPRPSWKIMVRLLQVSKIYGPFYKKKLFVKITKRVKNKTKKPKAEWKRFSIRKSTFKNSPSWCPKRGGMREKEGRKRGERGGKSWSQPDINWLLVPEPIWSTQRIPEMAPCQKFSILYETKEYWVRKGKEESQKGRGERKKKEKCWQKTFKFLNPQTTISPFCSRNSTKK